MAEEHPHKKPPDVSYESWVEKLIRDAQEKGEFDDLPGKGKPIEGLNEPYDENWWIKQKLEREKIPWAPEPIRLRREAEKLAEAIPKLPSEEAVREQVRRINALLKKANLHPAPLGTPPVRLLDEAAELDRWRNRPTKD